MSKYKVLLAGDSNFGQCNTLVVVDNNLDELKKLIQAVVNSNPIGYKPKQQFDSNSNRLKRSI